MVRNTLKDQVDLVWLNLCNDGTKTPEEVEHDVVVTILHAEARPVHEIIAVEKCDLHIVS
jgi:hypothetical protein